MASASFSTQSIFTILFIALFVVISVGAAQAAQDCSEQPSKAIAEARAALDTNDPAKERVALACLIEAVAALDIKLSDLVAGKMEFSGAITAKGFFYAKDETGAR